MTLEPGTYAVEWHSIGTRETLGSDAVRVERSEGITFRAPFADAGPRGAAPAKV